MADFNWAANTLDLMDATLNTHAAEIRQLQAAGVARSHITALYPVSPENYWRGVSELLSDKNRGAAALACFETKPYDVLTAAFKHGLLGNEGAGATLYAKLQEGAEIASLEYPGLSVRGSWQRIICLYGLPVVLDSLLTVPPERWVNWPPENLEYSFSTVKKAATGLNVLLTG